MITPPTGPLTSPTSVRPPLAGEQGPLPGPTAAPPLSSPPEAAPALPGDEGIVPRVVLESPEVAVDLDQLVFGPAAAGALPELPPAVTSLLAQASQRGTPLPFDAASLVAAAAADTTPLPGLEAVTGLLRLDVSRGVVPTVPVPPSPAGSAPRKAPRKQAPSGANILAKRNSLVDHLQRNAVRLVRAALTLGDLRTALHKATADGATPGTLRLLAAAIARMESLCNRLEHAIVVDGEALTRLDSAPEGEG